MPSPQVTRDLIDAHMLRISRGDLGLTSNAGAATGTATHKVDSGIIHTQITLTAAATLISAGDNASKGGGVKIFDFPTTPTVGLNIIGSRIKGTLSLSNATMSTTAGVIGLGTVVATGAIAVLSTPATFEDIHAGVAAEATLTANTPKAIVSIDGCRGPATQSTAASIDVFLNAAATFADDTAANLVIASGAVIDLWYMIFEA